MLLEDIMHPWGLKQPVTSVILSTSAAANWSKILWYSLKDVQTKSSVLTEQYYSKMGRGHILPVLLGCFATWKILVTPPVPLGPTSHLER